MKEVVAVDDAQSVPRILAMPQILKWIPRNSKHVPLVFVVP